MVIQPFLENAIIHGFANRQPKGILKISFQKMSSHQLKITIQDNGVGLQNTANLKRTQQHESSGVAITEQRIMLFGKIKQKPVSIQRRSTYPESVSNPGLCIEILLPYTEETSS